MIYKIAPLPSLVIGVDQIDNSQDKSVYTEDKIKADLLKRKKQDESEHHRRYGSRRSERIISRIPNVFEITRNVRNDQSDHIKDHKIQDTHCTKYRCEDGLHNRSKKIQRDHVKDQMDMILVKKPGGNEPVILITRTNQVWVHNKFPHYLVVAEGIKAYQGGNSDNNITDIHLYGSNHNDTK
jgi:hypothetical protein